jgi:hypothetical protein
MEKPLLWHLLPERLEGRDLTSGGERLDSMMCIVDLRINWGGLMVVQCLQWIQHDLRIDLMG